MRSSSFFSNGQCLNPAFPISTPHSLPNPSPPLTFFNPPDHYYYQQTAQKKSDFFFKNSISRDNTNKFNTCRPSLLPHSSSAPSLKPPSCGSNSVRNVSSEGKVYSREEHLKLFRNEKGETEERRSK